MEERAMRFPNLLPCFNVVCCLILLFFICNWEDTLGYSLLRQNARFGSPWLLPKYAPISYRRLFEISSNNLTFMDASSKDQPLENPTEACAGIRDDARVASRCDFIKSNPRCSSGGYIDYINFFYCDCEKFQVLGYAVLALWLLALFYLLGSTAADYFCCSLSKLSTILKLPPTVAGVTLLPLGNGAPDVFGSIAAFVSTGAGEVGLNGVLGGAVFVTCVVVGAISLCVAGKNVQIDRKCFYRDAGFLLLTLLALSLILLVGKVSVWGAVMFIFIYVVYSFLVITNEILRKHTGSFKLNVVTPLLPVAGNYFSTRSEDNVSACSYLFSEDFNNDDVPRLQNSLPQWMWSSNFSIYSNHGHRGGQSNSTIPLWGWKEDGDEDFNWFSYDKLFLIFEVPLSLPRRLTIPVVEEERWSKGYAVASATFSPLLLAFLWSSGESGSSKLTSALYVVGGAAGVALGVFAFFCTSHDCPPQKYLFPWVLGGFIMSIVWFYIVADELVSLFLALGVILGIKPSILGLTVMAWGNSMGDLMSNIALALSGGDGVQIAMSGCYAGPMFNTLVGLGISMLLRAFSAAPASYVLPVDSSLIYSMGFLMTGLTWALFILPRNDMILCKSLAKHRKTGS
ncbi:hypothetical protein HPP92_013281 [Vanilla planifolia]|uniref:Sodium/calcium exchanger membrane region domain-containing protein n=1 Tax=Vanilla planifolia TaxID=51239 RepID=A0A835UXU9_VANPL|nr:hypothetical protein HPP92_013281 [Vanilla planifolia]